MWVARGGLTCPLTREQEIRAYLDPSRLIDKEGHAAVLPDWPAVNTVTFSPDDKMLAVGTDNAVLQVVSPLTGFKVCETDVEAAVTCVAFHPFDPFVAASTSSGKVRHGNGEAVLTWLRRYPCSS
jgi:WD40 repeat protein